MTGLIQNTWKKGKLISILSYIINIQMKCYSLISVGQIKKIKCKMEIQIKYYPMLHKLFIFFKTGWFKFHWGLSYCFCCLYMAEILPIWRKTLSNPINQSINQTTKLIFVLKWFIMIPWTMKTSTSMLCQATGLYTGTKDRKSKSNINIDLRVPWICL